MRETKSARIESAPAIAESTTARRRRASACTAACSSAATVLCSCAASSWMWPAFCPTAACSSAICCCPRSAAAPASARLPILRLDLLLQVGDRLLQLLLPRLRGLDRRLDGGGVARRGRGRSHRRRRRRRGGGGYGRGGGRRSRGRRRRCGLRHRLRGNRGRLGRRGFVLEEEEPRRRGGSRHGHDGEDDRAFVHWLCRSLCQLARHYRAAVRTPRATYFLAGCGWARRIEGETTLSETWKSHTAGPLLAASSATSFGTSCRFLTVFPGSPKPRAMPAKSQ